MKRNIPFLIIKKRYWVNLMRRKMIVRKLKGGKINEDILNKRRSEAQIDKEDEIAMLQATRTLIETRENRIKSSGKEKI